MNKLILLFSLLWTVVVQAEVVTDGSLGAQVSLSGADYAITQDLGTLQDSNLFHSFEQFSLELGETATFSGDASIQNIFSRVTGGEVSTIKGLIRSTIPDADLYLMNPAGMVFTEGASLDLQGSFYTTTADVIRFSDGNDFGAAISQDRVFLSSAEPSAYGFLDNDIGTISISDTQILAVPRGKQLSLVGNNLNINNTDLFAGGGQVSLVSVGSTAEISFQPEILPTDLLSDLTINNATITANTSLNDTSIGSIYIRAGQFTSQDSLLSTTTTSSTLEKGGNIDIQVQNIKMQGTSLQSENNSQAQGGDIIIQAENDVILAAGTSQNKSTLFESSRISTATSIFGTGNSGMIQIQANNIQIQDGSIIQSSTLDAGNAGEISLNAQNDITFSGASNLGGASGILVDSGSPANLNITRSITGTGGQVSINAKNLTMNDGANIVSNSYALGQGGNININVSEKLMLEQESATGVGNFMSVATTSKDTNAGDGGNIVIQANELLFANGSFLTTNTAGAGNAGNISINVAQNATITGSSAQTDSGILSAAGSSSVGGNAGNIVMTVGNQLFMGGLAIIDASSFNRGLGGSVNIVAGDIVMRDQAYIGAASASSGNTGDISISVTNDNLEMYDESYITTSATFADGGNIYVSMPNYVYISGNSQVTTSIESGVGGGGNVDLDAEFTVLDGGQILAQAYGGPGGNIDIVTTSIYNLTDQPIEQAISASSQLGVDGVVTVRSPDGDTDEGVLILSGDFLQADRLLRSLCDKKRSQGNSFVVTGRESYPNLINDWLPSNATQLVLQRCEL